MKHSKFIAKYFFLIIIFIQIIFPIMGYKLIEANKIPSDHLNLDNIDFSSIDLSMNQNLIENNILDNKNNIFDDNLVNYINNIEQNEPNKIDEIKIIIEFKQNLAKEKRIEIIESIFRNYKIINNYEIINAVLLKINSTEIIEKESNIESIADITKIYKTRIYTTPVITDNNLKTNRLNKNSYPNWWIPAIGADDLIYDGTGVRVAVFDTGIFSHPDLNIVDSNVFIDEGEIGDINGHGTHVAGIIGSNGDSSRGIYRGVAPGVSLIDAHVGNMSGSIDDGDVISAIEWAADPDRGDADIISMSFGGPLFDDNTKLNQAISNAKENYGTIFVVSAGNSGPDYYTAGTPASNIDTISVGATNETNGLASFSSWGPSLSYLGYPDVVAPGVNIISTSATNSLIEKEKKLIGDFFDFSGAADYIPLSGTSMSCPIVSGAIAILKQAFPTITAETARIALQEGANKLPDLDDNDFLKFGAGLINVSASLEYLNYVNSINSDVNNITKAFPDLLPVKPFDLLHFPGDSQIFNLSIISGRQNIINLEIPNNISGISIISDNENIVFSKAGINFTSIKIKIEKNIEPGLKTFQINLTINGDIVDTINITLDIRLPEYKVLMESFHGLNDWFNPEFSFPQIGFYDAIKDLALMNISTDYYMEFWQPYYNISSDNSILTEEYLAQYDLIILQNPILPYSPLEIDNLKNYFNNGGNILFLGTRYDKMCSDNINYLFSELGVNTQIAKENIMDDEYVGLGSLINSIPALPVDNNIIFEDVDKYLWLYGNMFDVSPDAETIAQIDDKTVAVAYDGYLHDKGRFVAFGDLHWFYYDYITKSNNYENNHKKLLENLMNYFLNLNNNNVSITVDLDSVRTADGFLNISVYVKNKTTNIPLDKNILNTSITVIVENDFYSDTIDLYSQIDGIAYNDNYSLSFPSYDPYEIKISITIDSYIYNKTTKILFYNDTLIPKINSLNTNKEEVYKGGQIEIEANMNNSDCDNIITYLSLYSYGFHNNKETFNDTITLTRSMGTTYDKIFNTPSITSGYGIFYIIPIHDNYTASDSPRYFFKIVNYAPIINDLQSYFTIGDGDTISLSDTIRDESTVAFQAKKGDEVSFQIRATELEFYGDMDSDLLVSVNFFIVAISEVVDQQRVIWPIYPYTFNIAKLTYNSGLHTGSLIIPSFMEISTINGIKDISTNPSGQLKNYACILYINVIDKEGSATDDPYLILLMMEADPDNFIVIITVSLIGGIFLFAIVLYVIRRKKIRPKARDYTYNEDLIEASTEEVEYSSSINQIDIKFCPFCGIKSSGSNKFCTNCGKQFKFE